MPTNEVARQRARTLVQTEMARQGLTFAALADKAEIDPGTLGKFLDGTRWPHIPTRAKIESALGLEPGSLSAPGVSVTSASTPEEASRGRAADVIPTVGDVSALVERLRELSPEVRESVLRHMAHEVGVHLSNQLPLIGTVDAELVLEDGRMDPMVRFTNRMLGQGFYAVITPLDESDRPVLESLVAMFMDEARRAQQALLPVRVASV